MDMLRLLDVAVIASNLAVAGLLGFLYLQNPSPITLGVAVVAVVSSLGTWPFLRRRIARQRAVQREGVACKACGANNRVGARYCSQCAQPL